MVSDVPPLPAFYRRDRAARSGAFAETSFSAQDCPSFWMDASAAQNNLI
jgi:hypothetical protein